MNHTPHIDWVRASWLAFKNPQGPQQFRKVGSIKQGNTHRRHHSIPSSAPWISSEQTTIKMLNAAMTMASQNMSLVKKK